MLKVSDYSLVAWRLRYLRGLVLSLGPMQSVSWLQGPVNLVYFNHELTRGGVGQ